MGAYYNEFDPKAAAWLRELIKQGHIADGEVDERDLWDVHPDDLRGFEQVHLCAGIGVWSYALRRAGWPDDRPVWTGSFPCQPFSAAGKGEGFADERHLWPAGFHLIAECGPPIVFGEQVASKNADPWIDLVQADLEALGYAVGAVPFPSAGVGAPHIRDRLYWVADAQCERRERGRSGQESGRRTFEPTVRPRDAERLAHHHHQGLEGRLGEPECPEERPAGSGSVAGGLGHAERLGAGRDTGAGVEAQGGAGLRPVGDDARPSGAVGGLADATATRHAEARQHERGPSQLSARPAEHGRMGGLVLAGTEDGAGASGGHGARDLAASAGPTNGLWRDADWLLCRDGKWRPVEPGTFPLAHGAPARVVRLRGYGNAVNAIAAQTWIEAYLDTKTIEADAQRVRLEGVFA